MLQLRRLNTQDALQMKAFRLQVKERLYRFNFVRVHWPLLFFSCAVLLLTRLLVLFRATQEVLMQLEKDERQLKLEETFQSVCKDYERIMAPLHQ